MSKWFDMDNPIWRFMSRVADAFILSVLWAVFSIPIVTIGASTTAMYYVSLKMAEGTEEYTFRMFVKSFKENFVAATVSWLIILAVGALYILTYSGIIHIVIGFVIIVSTILVFPLLSRLSATGGKLFAMAFMTAIKNFGWTLFMIVIVGCFLAVGIFVFWPVLVFTPGAVALLHSIILTKMIFPRYGWNMGKD